jgi:hypothetical protein
MVIEIEARAKILPIKHDWLMHPQIGNGAGYAAIILQYIYSMLYSVAVYGVLQDPLH